METADDSLPGDCSRLRGCAGGRRWKSCPGFVRSAARASERQGSSPQIACPRDERTPAVPAKNATRNPWSNRRLSTQKRARTAVIRKLPSGKYRLYSRRKNPKTGRRRNLGTFATRAAAERHERAVQFFKRH